MPLGEIVGGLFEIIGRFLAEIFIQLIFELLIKGPGFLILRFVFLKKDNDIDPDGILVVFIGLMFWGILGLSAYYLYGFISNE